MANKPQKFLDLLAEQSQDLDDIIEDNTVSHRQRFVELQQFPEERDPVIWSDAYDALLGTVSPLVFEEWFLLDAEDYAAMDDEPLKAVLWQASIAASKMQADLEVVRDVIDTAEGHSRQNQMEIGKLSESERREAASEGIGNDRFKTARERRSDGG
jgi:hypothetical protein